VVVERHRHRVDRGVARFDALDGGFEKLCGRNLSPLNQLGEPGRVIPLVVGESAHVRVLRLMAAMLAESSPPRAGRGGFPTGRDAPVD
jgi:hypothetical protein